jgi:hypothetical protein
MHNTSHIMSAEITVISFFLATFLLPLEPWSLLPSALSAPKCEYSTGHNIRADFAQQLS